MQSQRYYLGLAYHADGQAAKEAEVFNALAKTPAAPVAADAQYMLGQGHIDAKEYAKAIPPLEKYLADRPDGEVADYALANLGKPVSNWARLRPPRRPWRNWPVGFPRARCLDRPGSASVRRRWRPSVMIAPPSCSGL